VRGARLSLIALAATTAGLAVAAAGCGSGDDTTSTGAAATTNGSAASPTASGGTATTAAAENPDLGQILVDSQGRTVYLFEKDEAGKSNCNGACAQEWPPLTTTGSPKAGDGIEAAKLDTVKRDDGSTQVVFDGHPLYLYAGDTKPGDANGNELEEFGAEWYALQPDGQNAEGDTGGGSSSGGGSGGYSY
jgi:predicted lipoprotein with Yx(FWY)xxD motif